VARLVHSLAVRTNHLGSPLERSTHVSAGLAALLVLAALFLVGVWLTFSLAGVLITLLVAAVVGWAADRVVPGRLPYGWLGATVAGLAGSWLGSALMGRVGPSVAGIPLLPAFVGALIVAFLVQFIGKRMHSRGRRTGEPIL
jgi:uncharacterized membrane protein YeaQ/YmgE (transglycosylase-associated protein family)